MAMKPRKKKRMRQKNAEQAGMAKKRNAMQKRRQLLATR